MSIRFTDIQLISTEYQGTKLVQTAVIACECDTVADLPNYQWFDRSDGSMTFLMTSQAHVIQDNTMYELMSDGTWQLQPPEAISYTYTKGEIDSMVSDINNDIGNVEGDLSDEVTARQTADAAIEVVLTDLINTGGKNKCKTNSDSQTGNWINIPLVLPPGEYMISFGTLSSTDTDATTCQLGLFNSSWTNLIGTYPQLERGSNITVRVTISEESATLRVYSSDTSAHGAGDTLTFSNLMVCSINDWNISNEYVPYCPTLAELYALVKSYHP